MPPRRARLTGTAGVGCETRQVMKFATRSSRASSAGSLGVTGVARVDRRSHAVVPRLRAGDIAVFEHLDLDRATAHQLVDAQVAGVVNAAAMISGRYASLGPEVLTAAGITVIDRAGDDAITQIKDGARVRLHEGAVYVGDNQVAAGEALDADAVVEQMQSARDQMSAHLTSFTHNTSEFLRREQDLLIHGRGLPVTGTTIADRAVVVVVEGHDHKAELAGAKRFIKETRPVLIGVDGGADALLAAGHKPDIVVLSGGHANDRDSLGEQASRKALRAARDVIVRLDPGSPASVMEPVRQLGLQPLRLESTATSEDAALILAEQAGATVIVGVGMHATLEEFLDRKRAGLASTFLTRLAVGPTLVDAATLPHLYSGRVRPRHLMAVTLAGLVAVGAAVFTTPVGQEWGDELAPQIEKVVDTAEGWLP